MSAADDKIYFLLQQGAHVLKKESDKILIGEVGITTAQAAVLAMIENRKGTTQKQIAERLRQNESAITAMVSRLIDRGLVTKRRSKSDARVWQIQVTQKGAQATSKAKRHFSAINRRLDDAIGPSNSKAFAQQLLSIIRPFDKT